MNGKIEILAPAGGPEALTAAVYAGADAVYLGGALFSARANAANFSREDLENAVAFAHERNVKIYVTVNTLLKDTELAEALDFCGFLAALPADGILVQDVGLLRLLKQAAPELPLHASTQMSIHAPFGAAFLREQGIKRVVLARELSLPEIREISEKTDVELEAFVHGALCMSLSGQCYFSAVLGGRSGSRGRCAQTCRLPFAAPGGTGHDLSLKDLSFIREVQELRAAGICSAKIEGRMKRPEYVAAAVSACRKAADGEEVPGELFEDLRAVFSRSGFTDGYPRGKRGREMFGTRTKEDALDASSAVMNRLHGLYRGERSSVPVQFEFSAVTGEPPVLTVSDGIHILRAAGETPLEAARNTPISAERIEEQLKKTGGTPYFAEAVAVKTDGLAAVPISALNALRRAALDKLGESRRAKRPVSFQKPEMPHQPHTPKPFALRARFQNAAQLPEENALRGLEQIILPLDAEPALLERLRDAGHAVVLELPRAVWGAGEEVRRAVEAAMAQGFTEFRCGSLDGLALCKKLGAKVHGGFSLNAFNTEALAFFEEQGVCDTELSAELSAGEIAALGGKLPRGALIYGRLPVMLTRNCPLANSPAGCKNCKVYGALRDRKGADFPVTCTKNGGKPLFSEVFNSVPVWLLDRDLTPQKLDFGVLYFTVENSVETEAVIRAAKNGDGPIGTYTRGLFAHGIL